MHTFHDRHDGPRRARQKHGRDEVEVDVEIEIEVPRWAEPWTGEAHMGTYNLAVCTP
jgi:hypothetical protein